MTLPKSKRERSGARQIQNSRRLKASSISLSFGFVRIAHGIFRAPKVPAIHAVIVASADARTVPADEMRPIGAERFDEQFSGQPKR
jgi:hypothetical protein